MRRPGHRGGFSGSCFGLAAQILGLAQVVSKILEQTEFAKIAKKAGLKLGLYVVW